MFRGAPCSLIFVRLTQRRSLCYSLTLRSNEMLISIQVRRIAIRRLTENRNLYGWYRLHYVKEAVLKQHGFPGY